jgi:hypothetical protein
MRIIDLNPSTVTINDLVPIWNVSGSTTNKVTLGSVRDLHELQIKGNHNLVQLASPGNSFAGDYNTVLGTGNAIAGTTKGALVHGSGNTINGDYSFAGGAGNSNTGLRTFSHGSNNTILANYAHTMGYGNLIKGTLSTGFGQGVGTKRFAEKAFGASVFSERGDNQLGMVHLNGLFTAPASGVVLTIGGDYFSIIKDSVIGYEAHVMGVQISGAPGSVGDFLYEIHRGVIRNVGGVTTIHSDTITAVASNNSGTWTATFAADNTNDRLQITCAGDAGQDIRWSSQIIFTQIGFDTFAL